MIIPVVKQFLGDSLFCTASNRLDLHHLNTVFTSFLALGNIFNMLITVNASCNFLLYCVLSAKYRSTFKSLFCERRLKRQDTLALSLTRSTNSKRFNPNSAAFKRNASYTQTPRNLEVTIYFFNKGKYVNTYNLCMKA